MGKGPRIPIRDVSPFLQVFRNFLLGRKHTLAVRFDPDVATRSPPAPVLPDGPSHKINTNYYFARDARREVTHPEILSVQKKIGEGEPTKAVQPGKVYLWD